jgi:hypothetical protein
MNYKKVTAQSEKSADTQELFTALLNARFTEQFKVEAKKDRNNNVTVGAIPTQLKPTNRF